MMQQTRRRFARAAVRLVVAGGCVTALAGSALAQQQPPQPPARTPQQRRPETIEIRGQVPTPQVVTVRPRETPAYSRRVLVPTFLDRSFWPSILPPLEIIVPQGPSAADTVARRTADSASRAPLGATRPPSGTPPAPLRP